MPSTHYVRMMLLLGSLVGCASDDDATTDPICEGKCDGTGSGSSLIRREIVSDPGFGLGWEIAMSTDGKTMAVGSLDDKVRVFSRGDAGWTLQHTLVSPRQYNNFGTALSISADGDTVVIGASGEKFPLDNNGAAYVATRTGATWSELTRLQAGSPQNFDYYGTAVAMSGDGQTLLVGATEARNPANAGTGYVEAYKRTGDTWTREGRIAPSQFGSRFGAAVALSGDGNTALVGSPYEQAEYGKARIYTRTSGTWTVKRELDDGLFLDHFGSAVALSADGKRAIVGAPEENNGTNIDHGAAFVYGLTGDSWALETKLVAIEKEQYAAFGTSVALDSDGHTAVIGAVKADAFDAVTDSEFNEGAAYVFSKPATEWKQTIRLVAGDGRFDDNFGAAAAISGDGTEIAIGAFYAGENTGAAYVYAAGADADRDLIADADDNCKDIANANQANHDTDEHGDACDDDDDGDSVADAADNCPINPNAEQLDTDADNAGDACDHDDDNDNKFDDVDNCILIPNPDQANLDNDALGDVCDDDDDQDTIEDTKDVCPRTPDVEQLDQDQDGIGDACDSDDDNDTVIDDADNCPFTPNVDQGDVDGNGVGNACDGDLDADGVKEDTDNCDDQANPDQKDLDGDGIGDVCDADDDGDSVADGVDNCAQKANADQVDLDKDGIGDACDPVVELPEVEQPGEQPGEAGDGGGCSTTRGGLGLPLALLVGLFVRRRRAQAGANRP